MIRAGQLDTRLTLQEQGLVDDGQGGLTRGPWTTFAARIAARVEPLSGDERIAAMQTQSGIDYEVIIRFVAGVKADMRGLWHANGGDRTLYLVGAPVVIGRAEGLRFMAREDAD